MKIFILLLFFAIINLEANQDYFKDCKIKQKVSTSDDNRKGIFLWIKEAKNVNPCDVNKIKFLLELQNISDLEYDIVMLKSKYSYCKSLNKLDKEFENLQNLLSLHLQNKTECNKKIFKDVVDEQIKSYTE